MPQSSNLPVQYQITAHRSWPNKVYCLLWSNLSYLSTVSSCSGQLFSRNVGKLFFELKLVTDNLPSILRF